MAIKIPSKNIYSIQNPKIRDNAIDNITIGYNKVSPLNEFDKLVYNDKQNTVGSYSSPQQDYNETSIALGNYNFIYGIAFVRIEPRYSEITSRIPIDMGNSFVKELLTGVDENGNQKINYNIIGTEYTGTATAEATKKGATVGSGDVSISVIHYIQNSNPNDTMLSIPSEDQEFSQTVDISNNNTSNSTSVTLKPKYTESTIKTATANKITVDGVEYFEISIKYLTGVRITKLIGKSSNLNTQITSAVPLTGEYTEYYPSSIEISFKGNTIGISTEDNTMTIGIGTKPLKIDGNELMQNTSDIEAKYKKTLEEDYANGKETATVLCTISDYYDYGNGQKVISPNGTNILDGNYVELWNANYNKNNGTVSQTTADNATEYLFQLQGIKDGEFTIDSIDRKTIYSSGNISLRFTKSNDFSQIRFKLNGKTIDTGISFDVSDLENGKIYFFHANVNIDGGQGNIYWDEMQITRQARVKGYDKGGLPMAFQLYDEVVPMIMRYDGKDYPLSVDASGNAKVFKVLGINIYFDGAIWQKLSLQEC